MFEIKEWSFQPAHYKPLDPSKWLYSC
ncbi:hypothetical protein A2U01_0061739, partial [Trifolium medium]|nr:hypothetical protein [Trifolium medium]